MYLDEITDLCDEIIHRLLFIKDLSDSEQKKIIKEDHFDSLVDFRDSLNDFIDEKWDFSDWIKDFKDMRTRFCERNDELENPKE